MQFTDQTGHTISLPKSPKRIISLVPSQTELLFDLNLKKQIIGTTKFCVHPKIQTKNTFKIGGTKNINIRKIIDLHPDLIIANKEENEKNQIEQLKTLFPVWTSDIVEIESALEMIISIGEITKTEKASNNMVYKINNALEDIENLMGISTKSIAYFIWRNPYMTAGRNTFINTILKFCGLVNVFNNSLDRYPIVNKSDLRREKPDYIFLSSEPFPFKQKHIKEIKDICPNSQILLVDGEMFSWYGSRLLLAPKYIKELLASLQ